MKHLFALIILVGTSINIHAQQCNGDTLTIPPSADSLAVFTPPSDSLPCLVTGQYGADTLYFTTYSSLQGFKIDSLTIDSINNLPAGLCWATNSLTNTFNGGQNGVLVISGITGAQPGQYKLVIYVHGVTNLFPIPLSNLETLLGFRYYLKVICPGNTCPAVDTAGGKDSLYIPFIRNCNAGINEVNKPFNNLTVSPNPFSNAVTVLFNAETAGVYTIRITNLLGEDVWSSSVKAAQGSNSVNVSSGGISSGVYIVSVSDGINAATTKVVVEQ